MDRFVLIYRIELRWAGFLCCLDGCLAAVSVACFLRSVLRPTDAMRSGSAACSTFRLRLGPRPNIRRLWADGSAGILSRAEERLGLAYWFASINSFVGGKRPQHVFPRSVMSNAATLRDSDNLKLLLARLHDVPHPFAY